MKRILFLITAVIMLQGCASATQPRETSKYWERDKLVWREVVVWKDENGKIKAKTVEVARLPIRITGE